MAVALSVEAGLPEHLVACQVVEDTPVAGSPVAVDIQRAFGHREQERLALVQVDQLAASGYLAA